MTGTPQKKTGSKKARASAARLAASQCVYQYMMTGNDIREIIEAQINHYSGVPDAGQPEFVTPDKELLSKVAGTVAGHEAMFEEVLIANLPSPDSKIENLMRAITLCGLAELYAYPEVDAPLIIAEYLHVTHAFYDGGEHKIVHAVLDKAKAGLR